MQYTDGRCTARGRLETDAEGAFRCWAVVPAPVSIPHDGPVGALLQRLGRSPMRPAHLHLRVRAPGLRPLVTQLFPAADEHLDADPVHAARPSLARTFARRPPGSPTPDGRVLPPGSSWSNVRFDIVLAPEGARRAARTPRPQHHPSTTEP